MSPLRRLKHPANLKIVERLWQHVVSAEVQHFRPSRRIRISVRYDQKCGAPSYTFDFQEGLPTPIAHILSANYHLVIING
jgi:hypothetical protein